jgi:cell division protein FtsZ
MTTIRRYAADDAHVIFGTAYDETLGDALRVTVIATGLAPAKRVAAPISVVQPVQVAQAHVQPQQRTGTDNIPVLTQPLNSPVQPVHSGVGAAPDYAVPSVLRTNRTQAAARVDALASNGMEEIEIPAFLRKQAD